MDSKKAKNLLGAVGLAAYLASGSSPVYSQTQNRIEVNEECSERSDLYFQGGLSAAGDGTNLRSSIARINLDSDSRMDLDNFFCFTAPHGDISYDVIGYKSGLEDKIDYEKRILDSRDSQSKAEREVLISHYEQLLENAEESDSVSLDLLKRSVSDGVLDVQADSLFKDGEWRILPGNYTIVGRSESGTYGEYIVNALPVPSEITLADYQSNPENGLSENEVPIVSQEYQESRETGSQTSQVTENVEVREEVQNELESTLNEYNGSLIDQSSRTQVQEEQDTYTVPEVTVEETEVETESTYSPATTEASVSDSFDFFYPRRNIGLEASLGTSIGIGVFGNIPLADESMDLGIYGKYYAKGDTFESSETEVTEIERMLIGPGTYLNREDTITTTIDEEVVGELGIRPALNFGRTSIFAEVGMARITGSRTLDGTSTISHERNEMPLGEPSVITNTVQEDISRNAPTFGLGLDYRISDSVSLGISGKNIDGNNSVRLNVKYGF